MLMLHTRQMREIADLLETGQVYSALCKVYEYGQLGGRPFIMSGEPGATAHEGEIEEEISDDDYPDPDPFGPYDPGAA